tara:strand:- start:1480 stop:1674 length:195 start_codon:yes stop_codon:yes gene_type:complete
MANTEQKYKTPEVQVEQEVIDYIQYGYSDAVVEKMLDDLYEKYGRKPTFKEMETALDNRADSWQ